MKNTAFILKPRLAKKVEQLKKEMDLADNGEVLQKAIQLLDLVMGRRVILVEKDKNKKIETEDFEKFNNTYTIE